MMNSVITWTEPVYLAAKQVLRDLSVKIVCKYYSDKFAVYILCDANEHHSTRSKVLRSYKVMQNMFAIQSVWLSRTAFEKIIKKNFIIHRQKLFLDHKSITIGSISLVQYEQWRSLLLPNMLSDIYFSFKVMSKLLFCKKFNVYEQFCSTFVL